MNFFLFNENNKINKFQDFIIKMLDNFEHLVHIVGVYSWDFFGKDFVYVALDIQIAVLHSQIPHFLAFCYFGDHFDF